MSRRAAVLALVGAVLVAPAAAPSASGAGPVRSCKGALQENIRVTEVKAIKASCARAFEIAETYVVSVSLTENKNLTLEIGDNRRYRCKYRQLSGRPGRALAKIACIGQGSRVYFYRTRLDPNPNPNSIRT